MADVGQNKPWVEGEPSECDGSAWDRLPPLVVAGPTRFALTFDYPGHCGETIVGSHILTRDSLEDAAERVARERGRTSIHIRTCNGEVVDREFTFGPSQKSEAA
jgi:hypothetical protein